MIFLFRGGENMILTQEDLQAIGLMIDQSRDMVLTEIGVTQTYLEDKINKIQCNLDELSQYYRLSKLESENTTILLQMIQDLKKEVDELKKKIA